MVKMILKIIGLVIVALGVIEIYDARSLSKNIFSYSDRNTSVKLLRICGFIMSIAGSIIIYMQFI